MFNPDNIRDLQYSTEKQIIDRKSARIAARDFSTPVVAMANADGGYLAIGIEDDGTITGIDACEKNLNDLLRVPFDYCIPSVIVENEMMTVTDKDGKPNHILRMHILPSTQVIANQADEVFLRVGDKSKKLNFDQRLQLVYAKGVKYFEDQPVQGAALDDIDLGFVSQYLSKIHYTKGDAEYYLRHNNDFITTVNGEDIISGAAILLFGRNPQRFFPRARIRFIRYEGRTAQVGGRMNVIKDIKFTGKILDQVQDAIAYIKTQIRDYTKLGDGAVFQTIPEYPEFCWTELIVNAGAHRDYSIKGTDIQIKMFDDHFVVESPGILPGLVRVNNIREFHFSRNPKIVELLGEYDLVKEFGEGVDRVYHDMEDAGLPDPVYRQNGFMLSAELRNKNWGTKADIWESSSNIVEQARDQVGDQARDQAGDQAESQAGNQTNHAEEHNLLVFCSIPRTRNEIMQYLGLTSRRNFRERYLLPLLKENKLRMTIPDKPNSPNQKYVAVDKHDQ